MVDLTAETVFVVGAGPALANRLQAMKDYGAARVHVFAADPGAAARALAGDKLIDRWPAADDFASLRPRIVFIADVADVDAARWRDLARQHGALVHVQDRIPLCDFHLPAILRRGSLQVTVSTDGAAAGLSRLLRDYIAAKVFGPEWESRVDDVSAARLAWKKEGLTMGALGDAIAKMLKDRGWLKP
jgi:precorrin-2 dehydrogenase/sirohydrochlorin ferrochelatase